MLSLVITSITLVNSAFSQHHHNHMIDKGNLVENKLYNMTQSLDVSDRILKEGIIIPKTDYEKPHLKRFIKSKTGNIFRKTYQELLENNITFDDVATIYNDAYNKLVKNENLVAEYNQYINAVVQRITPSPQSPQQPRGGGSTNRTPNQPCTNLDFEDGTWSSWDVFNGEACTAYVGCITNVTAGTASNGGTPQHLIMGAGVDPDVPISTLSPFGGAQSLRLGNINNGADAEYIENTFLVTANKPYFSYEYAVVVQSPNGHSNVQMPFFQIEFYDELLNSITDSCGNYYVDPTTKIAKETFDSVLNGGWWFYKDWARITVDLTPYIGQNVLIRFTTSDCTLGGHEGRAYLDASCHDAELDIVQDCQGIRLQAPLGYFKYVWNTGNPADTLDHLYVPGPGQYRVTLFSETGCQINIDTMVNVIYVKAGQNVTFNSPQCNGGTDGSINIAPYGGTLPYQFSIDNGATWQANPIFNNLPAGVYNVITNDSQGCGDTVSITLTEPPAIIPNLLTQDALCFGECSGIASVNPTGGTAPNGIYRIEWNGLNTGSNTLNNICAGQHFVTIYDEEGCSITVPFTINEPPQLVIDQVIVDDEVCYNNCDGRITIIDPDAVSYSIDNGFTWHGGNIFNNLCSQAGAYTVAIKNANGCVATQVVNINQPPPLEVSISPDTIICLNETATLTAAMIGGTPNYTYQWSHGKQTQVITEVPQIGYTKYSVVVTDANGCWVTGETSVTLFPQPRANFIYEPGPETDVFNTLIKFTNRSTSAGPLLYEWYFDDLGTSTQRDDFYDFPAVGGENYSICLKVENENGCRDSICKPLYVNYETLVYVPNTFTPDGDGVNDDFIPITEGLKPEKYKFYVFNRWGDLIFSTTSPLESWDGTFKGVKVKQDSYVWRIVGEKLSDDSIYEQIGHVNVLR